MTRIDRPASSLLTDAHLAGWTVSLILHGTIAFGAFLFIQQITLAPQQTPFQWDVAMVQPTTQATASSTPTVQQSSSQTSHVEPAAKPTPPAIQPSEPPPIERARIAEPPPQPIAEQMPPPVAEQVPVAKSAETTDHPVTQAEPIAPLPPPTPPASSEPASTPAIPPPSSQRDAAPVDPALETSVLDTPSQPMPSAPVEPSLTAREEADTTPKDEPPPQQVAALASSAHTKPAKLDYGWLTNLMAKWTEDLDKHYPAMLRTDGIQGKVTVAALLHDNGVLSDIRVAKSSGNSLLDQAAVEAVKNGPPLTLSRPLGRSSIPLKIPIVYILSDRR